MNEFIRYALFLGAYFVILGDPCGNFVTALNFRARDASEWNGRWFPHAAGQADTNAKAEYGAAKEDLYDSKHGIKMGVASPDCDDAKTNLTVDWDYSPINYTCFEDRSLYLPRHGVRPTFARDHIPANYVAQHKCMQAQITYDKVIPTFGTHRPLWAKFGEYRFLPKQRWLHDLEHGAVAMLYHPCADPNEVEVLRNVVKGCLYRHIITPYNFLPQERPFALVTWGHRLAMSKVYPDIAIQFIKQTALTGPEHTSKDGQYEAELLEHAEIVSDIDDSELCPSVNSM